LGSSLKAAHLGEGQVVAREGFEAIPAKSAIENSFIFGFSIICFYNSSDANVF